MGMQLCMASRGALYSMNLQILDHVQWRSQTFTDVQVKGRQNYIN